ncbi:MAG: DUF2231 domain-containing protein [Gemmatimonadaceae bacterium]
MLQLLLNVYGCFHRLCSWIVHEWLLKRIAAVRISRNNRARSPIWKCAFSPLAVGLGYLVGALIVLALVIYQGWLGGELVFRYGVGVAPTGQGRHPEPSASEHGHADHE